MVVFVSASVTSVLPATDNRSAVVVGDHREADAEEAPRPGGVGFVEAHEDHLVAFGQVVSVDGDRHAGRGRTGGDQRGAAVHAHEVLARDGGAVGGPPGDTHVLLRRRRQGHRHLHHGGARIALVARSGARREVRMKDRQGDEGAVDVDLAQWIEEGDGELNVPVPVRAELRIPGSDERVVSRWHKVYESAARPGDHQLPVERSEARRGVELVGLRAGHELACHGPDELASREARHVPGHRAGGGLRRYGACRWPTSRRCSRRRAPRSRSRR